MQPISIDEFIIAKIKEHRINQQYTQEAFGQLIGVSGSYISKVENTRSAARYSLQRINALAKALDCSLHDLLPENNL